MSHLSPAQIELLDLFDLGEMSDADFTTLALEAGFSHGRIDRAIRELKQAEAIADEDARELRAANGFSGVGA